MSVFAIATHAKRIALLIFLSGAFNVCFLTAATCKNYSAKVFWHGVNGPLYTDTSVWACISDEAGNCSGKGGYLLVENRYDKQVVRWSSTAAGQATLEVLGPKQKTIRYLAVYHKANEALTADLTVEVCK